MAKSKAHKVIAAFNEGKGELDTQNSLTRTCGRYFRPEYTDLDQSPFDGGEITLPNTSAGINAHQKMVNGLFSNTVTMGRGTIEAADAMLRDIEAVKYFYGAVGDKVNDIVSQAFAQPYHESLDDWCLGSVGVLYVDFDDDTNEHEIICYNPAECVWYTDRKGNPYKMYRRFEYTPDQAVDHFGYDEVSKDIQKAYDNDENCKFTFIHAMYPRKKRNERRRDDLNMPYEVLYVEEKAKKKVLETGTQRFRYVVYVQNKRRGLRTGYSSAMHALPSMRTAIKAIDDWFDAVEFRTRPAILMSDEDSVDNAQDIGPGDVRQCSDPNEIFLYGGQLDPNGSKEVYEAQIEEVNTLHYLDLFQALEMFKTNQMTAYEVSKIIAEKLLLIFPIVNSIKGMFSDVMVIVAQDIIQYGLIDEAPPPELIENENGMLGVSEDFRVRYTSRVDAQISGVETDNILLAVQEMAQAEGILMQTTDTQAMVKIEEILRDIATRRNVQVSAVRKSTEYKTEIARIKQERMAMLKAQADADAAGKRDVQKAPEEGSEAAG
ncbi:MAG: portal protein [Rickettsiales bacterium]